MPNLLPSRWSPLQWNAARTESAVGADDDLALGWESACPALQLEGWEPVPSLPALADQSLN
ncbi:MAG: hypothetical protein ACXWC2_06065 [Ramlibacter sp.]